MIEIITCKKWKKNHEIVKNQLKTTWKPMKKIEKIEICVSNTSVQSIKMHLNPKCVFYR